MQVLPSVNPVNFQEILTFAGLLPKSRRPPTDPADRSLANGKVRGKK
jgi:hypothetical protein